MKTLDIVDSLSEKVKRVWIEDDSFYSKILKNPAFEGAVLGSFSVYNQRERTCYVSRHAKFCDVPVSPTTVARKILECGLSANNRKSYPKEKYLNESVFLSAPLYCYPCESDFIYLDLKAAFYQIYSKIGFFSGLRKELPYYAPPWFFEYLPVDLLDYKLIRNCIVGCWRADSVTRIKNGLPVRREQLTPTTNKSAWNLIQAVLHGIAGYALDSGAIYVHTDGYIFPVDSDWLFFKEFFDDLGFYLEVKASGKGQVFGIGRYQIGEVHTKVTGELPFLNRVSNYRPIVLELLRLKKFNPHWKETEANVLSRLHSDPI